MTLLGELYAHGFGVGRDDKKATEWYRLAAERGDREAMFALAVFHLTGRAGAVNREQAAKLFAAAAKLGHIAAAYDLGLLYLEGQLFPQDFKRAAELFRGAAQAGSPEAQYVLATLYKEGRGVDKDVNEAARLLAAAAAAHHVDAQVEYAIALFNGSGVAKNETAAAALLRTGRAQGQPGGAEPARQHPRHRPRAAGRSGRGDQVAYRRQGGRRERRAARCLRAEADPGSPRRRPEGGAAVARGAAGVALLT